MSISILKKSYHVGWSDIDFNKKLKLSALFGYLQDAASSHAEELGVGLNKLLKEYNSTWVLIRIRVDILRHPLWNEELTVETWPKGPKKFEFERDYIVKDMNGEVIIRGVSVWLILDMETRQMKKSDTVELNYPPIHEERAIDCRLAKVKATGTLEIAYKKVISYSDIDINGHLTNSKYLDFIMDCFSVESHKKYTVASIQISYINEALPGDSIILSRDTTALNMNKVYIEGTNEKNSEPVFKAEVEVKKIGE
jgi:acyl-ACP thioesterase